MTDLPTGWAIARLAEICHIEMGQSPPSSTYNSEGTGLPFLQGKGEFGELYPTPAKYCSHPSKIARAGAVLLSVRAPVGPTNITPNECCIGRGLAAISPLGDISVRFVLWALRNHEPALAKSGTGSTFGAVSKAQVVSIPITLPPLSEQHRIVERIETLFDEIDRGVESLRVAKKNVALYRQSLLKSAFEGRLTAEWRTQNPNKLECPDVFLAHIRNERKARHKVALDEWEQAVAEWDRRDKAGKRPPKPRKARPLSMLGGEKSGHSAELPNGWLLLTAESVGDVQLGRQRSPRSRSKNFPTKYVRAANITEQGLALDDLLDMEFLPYELNAYRLEKGDLLLAEASGSAAQVGKPAIWSDQVPNCCFQNTVVRHQPYCRSFSIYLLWLYRYFYVSGKFAQVSGGVGINHLSASRFSQILLPICSPAEQTEIVRLLDSRLGAAERLDAEIDAALGSVNALRQSILKKAFAGQLVPRDPDDEPASLLLERIRAGHANGPATKRSARIEA